MTNSNLKPLEYFVGSWVGRGEGQPGTSHVEISFDWIMGGRFIKNRNRSTFAPQEQNPNGEVHEDQGIFSYDKARKVVVFRQFHIEGFVNQYVLTNVSEDGKELVFETEAIENIVPGFRARTTYRIEGENQFRSIFELAPPGAEYSVYAQNIFQRQ